MGCKMKANGATLRRYNWQSDLGYSLSIEAFYSVNLC
jgi:hypothetical protein